MKVLITTNGKKAQNKFKPKTYASNSIYLLVFLHQNGALPKDTPPLRRREGPQDPSQEALHPGLGGRDGSLQLSGAPHPSTHRTQAEHLR